MKIYHTFRIFSLKDNGIEMVRSRLEKISSWTYTYNPGFLASTTGQTTSAVHSHQHLNKTVSFTMFTIGPLFRSPESLNTLNSWVWIFGMVEREPYTLLIYPVPDKLEDTVVPIIERHVEAWSTIYNGGWSAYCGLNELGYNHSTVLHKHSFKKVYINQETREEVEIHTNRIEGAWKHAQGPLSEDVRHKNLSIWGPSLRNYVEGRDQNQISTRASFSPSTQFILWVAHPSTRIRHQFSKHGLDRTRLYN